MWAAGATALVSFGLSLFAMQSKVSSSTLTSASRAFSRHVCCVWEPGEGLKYFHQELYFQTNWQIKF